MAGTFQNLTGGRLLLNVVTGGESHEQRMFGDFLDKDARYARCDEFLHVVRSPVARRDRRPSTASTSRWRTRRSTRSPTRCPEIYFGGSSPAAGAVAAKHADVYLTWGEPPAAVREKIDWIRKLAADEGREVRFGIRMHTITRDTADEAWAEADRLLAGIDPDAIAKVQEGLAAQRVRGPAPDARAATAAARTTSRSTPTCGPASAWSAAARAPPWSAATSRWPTGSRSTPSSGIDEFILSGYPHLENAYWFGEGVLPDPGRARPLGAPGARPPYDGVGAVRGPGERPMSVRTAVVVGNPKPASRTLAAATTVARGLTGAEPDLVVDLATLGARLLDWQDPSVAALVDEVGAADLVVVASPTYKATYTGLLKLFLDRFAGGVGLRGVAVPLMLGAGAAPRARARAAPAPAARRARGHRAHLRPLRPRPGARPRRVLRRVAGPVRGRSCRPT